MSTVISKSFTFIIMILLGYSFKKRGIIKPSDSRLLMKLVINITLPAVIINGFRDFTFDNSLMFAVALGFFFNIVLILFAYISARRYDRKTRALYMLNVPTYNIGNFVLPFVQGFMPNTSIVVLSMFDIGNNPVSVGVTYAIASNISGGEHKLSAKDIANKLLHSPPFMAYVVMILLYLLPISIPTQLFDITTLFAQANTFLVMFSIGVLFEIHIEKEDLRTVIQILSTRYSVCIITSLLVFFLTPFPLIARQTLCLCILGPITTLSIPYGLECGCKESLTSILNSFSMIISFILTVTCLLLWI